MYMKLKDLTIEELSRIVKPLDQDCYGCKFIKKHDCMALCAVARVDNLEQKIKVKQ